MFPSWVLEVTAVIFLIWLISLTILVLKERAFLRQLFPESGERDIRNKLKEILEAMSEFSERERLLVKNLAEVKRDILLHIQKVAVLRYNPYSDTGGDQSFSAILLDGNLNGLMVTSLHSRSGTRIYAKIINKGKSDLELSSEEKEVLEKVINE